MPDLSSARDLASVDACAVKAAEILQKQVAEVNRQTRMLSGYRV
jgi:hypothetical protein